jgi:hypothetical protein
VEQHEQVGFRGGQADELDDGRGRDAERSFGTDNEMDKVVARHVFRELAAQPDDFACGRDEFEPEDIA